MKKAIRVLLALAILLGAAAAVPHVSYACEAVIMGQVPC